MKTSYFQRNLVDFSRKYGIFLGFRKKKTRNFVEVSQNTDRVDLVKNVKAINSQGRPGPVVIVFI